MAAKVLILAGDAAESLEVLYPYQRLREEGYEVHIAAPSKKKLQFVVHDFVEGYDTYTEKPGYTWPADLAFREVDPARYAALVIPGGRGAGVHPQRPGLPADHPALLRAREAGGAALPRGARARGGGRAARAADGGVPGAGAGRARGGGGVRRRGGGGDMAYLDAVLPAEDRLAATRVVRDLGALPPDAIPYLQRA